MSGRRRAGGDLEGQVDREQVWVTVGMVVLLWPTAGHVDSQANMSSRYGAAISLEGLLLASSVRVSGGPPLCGAAFPQVTADRQGRSRAF